MKYNYRLNQNRITYCTFLVVEDSSPSISQLCFLHQIVTAITAVMASCPILLEVSRWSQLSCIDDDCVILTDQKNGNQ